MSAPDVSSPRRSLWPAVGLFVASALFIAAAAVDAIPLCDNARLIWQASPTTGMRTINPLSRTAWYQASGHEGGLVRESIEACVRRGVDHSSGFPVYLGRKYYSAVGLYNVVWGSLAPRDPARLAAYFERLERILALMAGLVVAFFATWSLGRLGVGSALGIVFSTATSFYFLVFARSLYWHWALALLPMVVAFTFHERLVSKGRTKLFYLLIAAGVFAKALMSYEYITNIILAAALPTFFFSLESGTKIGRLIAHGVKSSLAGTAGFLAAIVVNVLMIYRDTGSWAATKFIMLGVVKNRTIGPLADGRAWVDDTSRFRIAWDAARCDMLIFHPMTRDAVRLSTVDVGIALAACVAAYLFLTLIRAANRDRTTERLFLTSIVALAFSLSWPLLARNHLFPHVALNPIIYVVPFLPVAGLTIGRFIQWLLGGGAGIFRTTTETARSPAPAAVVSESET